MTTSPPRSLALDALSPLARERLAWLGLHRDAAWTVARAELAQRLRAMGWPCADAVLDAEDAVGGLAHPPDGHLGVAASLRYVRGEAPWQRDDLQDYGLERDPRPPHEPLLPLWVPHDPRLWTGQDGRIVHGSHIDGPGYLTPTFEDAPHYVEVLALLDGFVVAFMRPLVLPRPRLEASSFAGEAIAAELGLTSFAPATRGVTRAWVGPGVHAVELDLPGFKQGTDVVSDTAEGLVLAAARALDASGTLRLTSLEPLDRDLLAELPVPTSHERLMSHVYTWGKHGDYSDLRYRRRHRERVS